MNKKIIISALLLAGTMMLGCNPKEILEPTNDFPSFVVIDGDTVKTRIEKIKDVNRNPKYSAMFVVGDTSVAYKSPKKIKPSKVPDLNKYKNELINELKGKPFRMISIGGSLAAGKRDGGLFNESIETAYPALIANQMGANYNKPLFDNADYNGFGRLVKSGFNPTGGPVPKQKLVKNNLAFESEDQPKGYFGKTDNYFVYSKSNEKIEDFIFNRMKKNEKENDIIKKLKLKSEKFDFVILNIGFDELISYRDNEYWTNVCLGGFEKLLTLKDMEFRDFVKAPDDGIYKESPPFVSCTLMSDNTEIVKRLVDQKLNKGVILNLPDPNTLPIFKDEEFRSGYQEVLQKYNMKNIYIKSQYGEVDQGNLADKNSFNYLLLDTQLDSLLGPNINPNLKPGLTKGKPFYIHFNKLYNNYSANKFKEFLNSTNSNIQVYSQYSNMPVVDIYSLYLKIDKGNLITDDGVKVDPSWPKGNFFSTDGINPTAFGQAVIANEVIKVINSHFKVNIELISTRHFLNP